MVKKVNKIFSVIVLCILISGCTIKYDIEFTKDMLIKENISVLEENSRYNQVGTSNEIYLDLKYELYQGDKTYNQYKFEKNIGKKESGISAITKEQTIEEYLKNNKVKKTLFGEINIERVGDKVIVSATKYRGESFFDIEDTIAFKNDEVQVSIKTPFKVYNHNADEFNEKKGIYIWKFNPNVKNKEIAIEFNDSLTIKDKIKNFIIDFSFIFITIGVIIVLVLGIIIRNKQVNKI